MRRIVREKETARLAGVSSILKAASAAFREGSFRAGLVADPILLRDRFSGLLEQRLQPGSGLTLPEAW